LLCLFYCISTFLEGSKTTSAPPSVSAVTDPPNPTKSVDDVAVETGCLSGASVGHGIAHSAYVDMPIDPNEPTFCLCKQVSFGEMIGCDNPDVSILFLFNIYLLFVNYF